MLRNDGGGGPRQKNQNNLNTYSKGSISAGMTVIFLLKSGPNLGGQYAPDYQRNSNLILIPFKNYLTIRIMLKK